MTSSIRLNLTTIALVLVLLSIAIVSSAQSGEAVAIFLKGGDVRFGKILKQDNSGNITLRNECGIYNIKAGEIDSIKNYSSVINEGVSDLSTDNQTVSKIDRLYSESKQRVKYRERGFYNLTSVALLLGRGQDGFLPVPSLTTLFGHQFNKKAFAGIGVGYEFYEWSVAALFAEGKYMLNQNNVMPFVSFKIGYSLPITTPGTDDSYETVTKYYGGIQLNPEAGIRLHIGEGSSLMLSLGYHFQQLAQDENTYTWTGGQYTTKVNTDYNRVSLRIGFMF